MKRRTLLGLLPALLVAPGGLCAPPETDFSGTWKQSNERSTPPRSGDVTLRIDHHDPDLTVETAIVRGPSALAARSSTTPRTAGLTFRQARMEMSFMLVVWNGRDLVFAIEEHEEGRVILSHETAA